MEAARRKKKKTNKEYVNRRPRTMVFALMGIMVAGVMVALKVTDTKSTPPRNRAVLQCEYEVRGKTVTKNIQLTPEEAEHIKVKGNCQVKKCRIRLDTRTMRKKFFDCKPFTEEKI